MSADRQAEGPQHDSAIKAVPESQRESRRDRPSRLDGSIGNATLADLMGRREGGRALPAELRARLERTLGTSLGDVRVHDDSAARSAAQAVDAEAFASGHDIYLGSHAPGLDTPESEPLLAHEVAHVEQQRHATAVEVRVSTPGDAAEREAQGAATQALAGHSAAVGRGGTVAGVQREKLSITKKAEVTRDHAEQALRAYLQRVLAVKPAPDLRRSGVVRTTLMKVMQSAGGSAMFIDLDKFLSQIPNDPVEFARRFAQRLPATMDTSVLEALGQSSTQDPQPGTGERVGDLVKSTKPAEDDPSRLPAKPNDPAADADKAAQIARQMRGQPEPSTIGPVSVDILRVGRILGGLGKAVRGQPPRAPGPEARTYPEVDAAIKKIEPGALAPPSARGTELEGNFPDARAFAQDLATKLDIAQQQGLETISLQLGVTYANAGERQAAGVAAERIIAAIRAALPHHASKVVNVDVMAGDKWLTRGRAKTSE